jgi:hypothetical protein
VAKGYPVSSDPTGVKAEHKKNCEDAKRKIIAFLNGIEAVSATQLPVNIPSSLDVVTTICRRFSLVARELRQRRVNRAPLQLNDEYDVQYLLHALLKIHFDDVRTEEWTPSYAGASARMDFLLKSEKTVIEAKMTRLGLKDREVGEQLLIDIEKYVNHSDCETLICFVYDPEHHINNPRGLERDLSRPRESLSVVAIIA